MSKDKKDLEEVKTKNEKVKKVEKVEEIAGKKEVKKVDETKEEVKKTTVKQANMEKKDKSNKEVVNKTDKLDKKKPVSKTKVKKEVKDKETTKSPTNNKINTKKEPSSKKVTNKPSINYDLLEQNYQKTTINKLEKGVNSKLVGKATISMNKTKKNDDYIVLLFTDSSNTIYIPVWQNSMCYEELLNVKEKEVFLEVYGIMTVSSNGSQVYENFNLQFCRILEVKKIEFDFTETEKYFKTRLSKMTNSYLKMVLDYAVKNEDVTYRLRTAPSTITSAYSYRGGLLHHLVDFIDVVDKLKDSKLLETTFKGNKLLNIDYELILTAGILSLLGKAATLEFNEKDEIVKTVKGELGDDILYSREIAYLSLKLARNTFLKKYSEEVVKNSKKEVQESLINSMKENLDYYEDEILHMISSSKSVTQYNNVSVPRSKNALFLANILNIVFNKYIFAKLEEENKLIQTDFLRLYNNGKIYRVEG